MRAFRAAGTDLGARLHVHGDLTKNERFGATLRQLAGDDPAVALRPGRSSERSWPR